MGLSHTATSAMTMLLEPNKKLRYSRRDHSVLYAYLLSFIPRLWYDTRFLKFGTLTNLYSPLLAQIISDQVFRTNKCTSVV